MGALRIPIVPRDFDLACRLTSEGCGREDLQVRAGIESDTEARAIVMKFNPSERRMRAAAFDHIAPARIIGH